MAKRSRSMLRQYTIRKLILTENSRRLRSLVPYNSSQPLPTFRLLTSMLEFRLHHLDRKTKMAISSLRRSTCTAHSTPFSSIFAEFYHQSSASSAPPSESQAPFSESLSAFQPVAGYHAARSFHSSPLHRSQYRP